MREKTFMTDKHREKIHKESKFADDFKKLPFKFSKPKRPKWDPWEYECPECGHAFSIGRNTVMVICSACQHLLSIEEDKKVSRW